VVTGVSAAPRGGRVLTGIGLFLSGLGAFLLVSGFMLRFFVAHDAVKFPLNEYQVATLTADHVTYFSAAQLKDLTGVSMRVTRTVEGDVAAGTDSHAVWTQFTYTFDATNKVPFNAVTQRSAFDRRTGAAVACCGEAVGAFTGPQSGQVYTWPIGAGQQTYNVFDTTLNKAVPAVYSGQETVDGITANRYVEHVNGTPFGTQKLPGSLVGLKGQPSATLTEVYQATNTYWVDPVTGAVINLNQDQKITLRDKSGVQRLVLFQGDFQATPGTVASIVAADRPRRAAVMSITTTVPLILGLSGAVILAAGILLVAGRRKKEPVRTAPKYETVAMAP
jgi:Porin PorA